MINILIIDDSSVIRDLLKEYLLEYGFNVDIAVDGADGIKKALENNYRLIFCDIHMPKKNGYQVFQEVSAHKPESTFIMTDSLPDQLAQMAEDAGALCCLQKPFNLDEVRAIIEKLTSTVNWHESR